MNALLLMMGGSGTRFGGNIPKQYIKEKGKPIFWYILKRYADMEEIGNICIVSNKDWIDFVNREITDINFGCPVKVVEGGRNRSESVLNGLKAINDEMSDNDVVLIHDATHPYVDKTGTIEVATAAEKFGGATLGACQYDTCYSVDDEYNLVKVIPRESVVSGASPEGFRYKDISEIFFSASEEELAQMTSAGAIALAHDISMKVVPTKMINLKITYKEDFELFKLLLAEYRK